MKQAALDNNSKNMTYALGNGKDPSGISEDERRLFNLSAMPTYKVLETLSAAEQGLSEEEAENRLDEYGPNEMDHARHRGFFSDILERCKSPLVIQLFVIAIVSGVIGELKSSLIVAAMVLLSVGLSYVLDNRSNRAVEALGKRVQPRAHLLRDRKELEIRVSEIVPGDIVLLQAGSIIPADLRLISAKDFFVNQSSLSGESMAVEKTADPAATGSQVLFELSNTCFRGSNVTSGSGRGVVINTGMHTVFGSISQRLVARREETSFDLGLKSFTWLMIRFMVVMVSAVFFIVGLTKGNWLEALLFGLSVAVGLTPEMLPMIVTVNLAKGALTMSKKKVIVKSLPSIQNFGAMDILCTDKTGTLTQDKVILEQHVDITGGSSEDVLNYAYLNSYFQTGLRSLIDRAVLDFTDLAVEHNCRRVDELPFDFHRRRMSVVVDYEGDHVLICKGAVEEIYSCCGHYQIGEEIYPLIGVIREDLFESVEDFNKDGYRVLAIAYREFPRQKTSFNVADESNLILLGYIAFLDPPKDSATEALKLLKGAGVRMKVLTGDNGLVTKKICRDVGLTPELIVTGGELARLSQEDFNRTVLKADVFVKLTPIQKEEIVKALRRHGHVVGFLGDGINDAPALKAADVGISVDSATDVAKEAADIVLLEKNLLILEEGIIEGRKVFANIVKYIRMGASSNFGNMFSVLGASFLLPFLPMKPVQVLTNNLLYDLSQTGIPMDRVDDDLITKPLKWNISNVKRFMIFIGPISSLFDYATFALMWFFFNCRAFLDTASGSADKASLESLFQTGWFVESLLTQTLIVHIIRTRRIPFFGSNASIPMTLTTLLIMGIGAWLPYSPFASLLGMTPLPGIYWAWIAGFLVLYSLLTHTVKTWFFKRFGGE
jgi:P-type Mg2+ transporter